MPRKIKVVDIQEKEEPLFETAKEEDVKDDYVDVKEEAVKEDEPVVEEPVNEPTVITEPKDEKPQKELVKCQYCNKNMLPKSLKYSHYQNCQGFKKINKINDKTPATPTPTTPPPPTPPEPPTPAPVAPAVIAKPKPKPRPKPIPQEEINQETEASPQLVRRPHPRTERMNLLKERYNNLVKNAFNV